MKLQMFQNLKKCGPPPPIYFNYDPIIGNQSDKNQNYLKVEIKTQPGEVNIKNVSLYILIFKTSLAESLLKFLVLLKKILKDWNLTTGPQYYVLTKNLLAVEAIQVF